MLTTAVNIAVFAAFSFRAGYALLSDAEFKAVCRSLPRDVSHYEWQKRQDVARSGEVGGTNGKDGRN